MNLVKKKIKRLSLLSLLTPVALLFVLAASSALAADGDPAQEARVRVSGKPSSQPSSSVSESAAEPSEGLSEGAKDGNDKSPSFVDEKHVNGFLDALSNTSRDTSKSEEETSRVLKLVLDRRLPLIDERCDINISHELLRLGYAYLSKTPGAEAELRATADAMYKKKDADYKGVTAKCRVALKGFSVAVLRVYLGADWSEEDEKVFEKASVGDDIPPPPAPATPRH